MNSIEALVVIPQAYKKSSYFFDVHLGVGYVAAELKRLGYSVRVLDLNLEDQPWIAYGNILTKSQPKLLAITSTTSNFPNAIEALSLSERLGIRSIRCIGGPHVTACNLTDLRRYPIDIAVRGEAESSLENALAQYRVTSRGMHSDPGPLIASSFDRFDIATLPAFPWELFDINSYLTRNGGYLSVMCSRGCPHACFFCASPFLWSRKVLWRPLSSVLMDIDAISNLTSGALINFRDDDIALNPQYLIALSEALLARDLHWMAETAPDSLTRNLSTIMSKAGLRELRIGIESPGSKARRLLGKQPIDIVALRESISLLLDLGVPTVKLNVLVGIPGLTYDEQMQEIEACSRLAAPGVYFTVNVITPLPGTSLFSTPSEFGIKITTCDFGDFAPGHVCYSTSEMTCNQIQSAYDIARQYLC